MHLDGGNEFLRTPFQSEAIEVTHVPGQLVLFPSWLSHEVRPYFGQRPRIVIAFNAWVVIDGDSTLRG
jgi:predicted 2-oxoglutarate/Fe(II)-dependent dioxygenase YbiX